MSVTFCRPLTIYLYCKIVVMRKLEITLSEKQYQHIQEEIKYANRTHLSEGVFGGYELCLQAGINKAIKLSPDSYFPASS